MGRKRRSEKVYDPVHGYSGAPVPEGAVLVPPQEPAAWIPAEAALEDDDRAREDSASSEDLTADD